MTRARRGSQDGKGPLSEEDAALWNLVVESTEPLRGKPRVPAHETDARRPVIATNSVESRLAGPRAAAKAPPAPAPPPAPGPAPPLADFDRRKAKKLAAGREAIDARIDLHGMRQSEAHAALRGFLLACHADGRRNVLVITGKGGAAGDDDASRPFTMDSRERGVLRRNVPIWLAEPELRAVVVSYRDAARGHGGSGALYVHLRARRKAGR